MGNQEIHEIAIINSNIDSNFKYNNKEKRANKSNHNLLHNSHRNSYHNSHHNSYHNSSRRETKESKPSSCQRKVSNLITSVPSIFNKRKDGKSQKLETPTEIEENQNFEVIITKNTESKDETFIDTILMQHFFMHNLEREARKIIIKEMSLIKIKAGKCLFERGEIANYFYIVKKGILSYSIDKSNKKQFIKGDSIGAISLLHGSKITGNAYAVTDCLLWSLKRKNFKKVVEHISKKNYEESKKFIDSLSILSNIEEYQKSILSSSLYKETFEKGKLIVKQGDQANCLYIIKEGEVECVSKEGKVVKVLKQGENFGERSILVDSKRTLDVRAKTDCVCYSISISTIKGMLSSKYRSYLYLNLMKSAFKNSKFFSKFSSEDIDQVFQFFQAFNLGKDNVAFPIGYKKSNGIVIIIDGNLLNSRTGKIIASRGAILFEEELYKLSNDKTNFALFPYPDVLILEAETKKILNFLKCNSFEEVVSKSQVMQVLSNLTLFKNLPRDKISKISTLIEIETYDKDVQIIKEGESANKFFIVKSGSVSITANGEYLRTLHPKEFFGERALLTAELRSASVYAKERTELYSLNKQNFISNIEENMKNFLIERLFLQDNSIELNDLLFIKELGRGSYGSVSLVKSSKNNYLYAIKSISKHQINKEKLHQNIEMEKSILLEVDHLFIVKLVKFLQDNNNIYFVLEYLKGQDLFDVIREIGLLSKEKTQFYSASMMLAIKYLHDSKFIFRDLKPENIMVNTIGYIKLIDFGTAKQIENRTSTIIGTPHYMAPEIFLGEGYSFQVDFWSIGICMYEFFCGEVPFGESTHDPMEIYTAIIQNSISFPSFIKDQDFKNLMLKMLNKNPLSRLSQFDNIRNHIWWKGFNWEKLMSLNMEVPYIPKEKNFNDRNKGIGRNNRQNSVMGPFLSYVNSKKEKEIKDIDNF